MYKVITFIFLYPLEEAEEVSSTKKQKSKLKKNDPMKNVRLCHQGSPYKPFSAFLKRKRIQKSLFCVRCGKEVGSGHLSIPVP